MTTMREPSIDTDALLFRIQTFLNEPGLIASPWAAGLLQQCLDAITQLQERVAAERAHRLLAEEIDDGR